MSYAIKVEKEHLGFNSMGEQVLVDMVYLYMGRVRLDVTDLVDSEVEQEIGKLKLMGYDNGTD